MKTNEMTWFQKSVYEAIKNQVKERGADLKRYMPIEFLTISEDINRPAVRCYETTHEGSILTHYSAVTRFKPEHKWEESAAVWDVCLYSNGDCAIYFDGTMYER